MTPRARSVSALVFTWAGTALFVVSLLYCVGTYEGAMGRTAGASFDAFPNALVNVALFTGFALHHSVFARAGIRRRIQALVSPALERSVYVWIASLLLIMVCWLWRPVYGVLWEVAGPAAWALRLVQMAGVWLTIRSAAVIDVLELAGVRQARASDFKTAGPYGWVRHPIYAGWLLVVFAEPVMTATRATFAVVSGLYLVIAIPFEERSLRASSGDAYTRYASQVRWKLVPYLY
jgi:protein-S-isoprenylcysteine O-methyltransferase Ste14